MHKNKFFQLYFRYVNKVKMLSAFGYMLATDTANVCVMYM